MTAECRAIQREENLGISVTSNPDACGAFRGIPNGADSIRGGAVAVTSRGGPDRSLARRCFRQDGRYRLCLHAPQCPRSPSLAASAARILPHGCEAGEILDSPQLFQAKSGAGRRSARGNAPRAVAPAVRRRPQIGLASACLERAGPSVFAAGATGFCGNSLPGGSGGWASRSP